MRDPRQQAAAAANDPRSGALMRRYGSVAHEVEGLLLPVRFACRPCACHRDRAVVHGSTGEAFTSVARDWGALSVALSNTRGTLNSLSPGAAGAKTDRGT